MATGGLPIGQWSGSDATKALHETIKEFSKASGRQTKWMLGLTWAIALLTLVMAFGLGVQIFLALKSCA